MLTTRHNFRAAGGQRPLLARGLLLGLLLLVCGRAGAAVTLTNLSVVNITPSSFSIVGVASATPSIAVFSDSGGVSNLAGQVGIEFYPLHTGDPTLTNAYDRRQNQASLQQKTVEQGLFQVRVSDCSPGTTYYYRLQVTDSGGQQVTAPASGPLPGVTTAQENDFVAQSLQVIFDLPGIDPSGSIIVLSNSNTPSLLAAVAGDGVSSNKVYFNLSDMLALSGATNFLPIGSQQFTASVLGASNSISQIYAVNFTGDFVVGSESELTAGSFAVLTFGFGISRAGSSGSLSVGLNASALTNLNFIVGLPTNRFSSLAIQSLSSQLGSAILQPIVSNSLMITLSSAPGQTLSGNQEIAQLNFTTVSNQSSAFVPVSPLSVKGTNADGSSVGNLAVAAGRLVIVGKEPLLEQTVGPNYIPILSLYGIPGDSYQIQSSTNLGNPNGWHNVQHLPMTNLLVALSEPDITKAAIFYRAYQFTAAQPILDIKSAVPGGLLTLLLYGTPSSTYEVDYAPNLRPPIPWSLLSNVTLSNSFQFITVPAPSAPAMFYRALP